MSSGWRQRRAERERSGPRSARALLCAPALLLVIAACAATEQPAPSVPVASIGPGMTVSPAVDQTRVELVRVLGAANLVLTDTQAPVRPAESAVLAAAPRAVFQVTLPADPTRGFIVVYEFSDSNRAAEAAAEEQHYLATGPGRVQSPEGTVHVLRQVGPTVVLYEWLPGAAKDPAAPEIQRALETLGVGYPIDS
ncbi:MAG: hypothetical protein Q7S35_12190 [Candidatus Limnocylindrales bacterium]|nr:hypothetical protein [Candidatus Limnocylindrales bacterium]